MRSWKDHLNNFYFANFISIRSEIIYNNKFFCFCFWCIIHSKVWHWCQTVWFIAPRSDIFSASLRAEDATLALILCKITKGITQMAPINLQKKGLSISRRTCCVQIYFFTTQLVMIVRRLLNQTRIKFYFDSLWGWVRIKKNIYDADKLHINYGAITLLLCIWCIVKIQQLVITIRMRISGLKPY